MAQDEAHCTAAVQYPDTATALRHWADTGGRRESQRTNDPAMRCAVTLTPSKDLLMRKILLASTALLIGSAATAAAQTQVVGVEVQAINSLSFAGEPVLVISATTAGSAPTAASSTVATYAVTTNETNRMITAQINSAMPTGVALTAALAAPSGATSAGVVTLTTSAQPVVTGIATLNASGLAITYGLSATAAAGVMATTTRTITYTILAGA
jgi:hypothetical protein